MRRNKAQIIPDSFLQKYIIMLLIIKALVYFAILKASGCDLAEDLDT
jgi:hypothetical protein